MRELPLPSQPLFTKKPLNSPSHCLSRDSTVRHGKWTSSVGMVVAISDPSQAPAHTSTEKLHVCGQSEPRLRKSTRQDVSENSYIGRSFTCTGRASVRRFSNQFYLSFRPRTLREKTCVGSVCGGSLTLTYLLQRLRGCSRHHKPLPHAPLRGCQGS